MSDVATEKTREVLATARDAFWEANQREMMMSIWAVGDSMCPDLDDVVFIVDYTVMTAREIIQCYE